MALYNERDWRQTKKTEQLTFLAGEDLPYSTYVYEDPIGSHVVYETTADLAIGYVLSPKGVRQGEKVDVQMLKGLGFRHGGGGGVLSINSIIGTGVLGDELQLVNDVLTPPPNYYYGTDALGVKGWYPLPAGGGGIDSLTAVPPNVFLTGTPTDPIINVGTRSWEWSGTVTSPVLNNIQNDYTQAGMDDAVNLRVNADIFDPPLFTGFDGGTEGRVIIVHNVSDVPIYFMPDDVNSLPENRILFQGYATFNFWPLYPNGMVFLQYDSTLQRWRMLGRNVVRIADDGSGVISVGGDDTFPLIQFNGVFTTAPITGNGTAGSPLTLSGIITDVQINKTMYVDPTYGDDGTALYDSLVFKWKSLDAALADWINDYVIHLLPGNHDINVPYNVNDQLRIQMDQGAILSTFTGGAAFTIADGQRLTIIGPGEIICGSYLFTHANPTSGLTADVIIDVKYLQSTSPNTIIGDITSITFAIEALSINDLTVVGTGWSKGYIATDYWISSTQGFIDLRDFQASNGDNYYDAYGPQIIEVKGKTAAKCKIKTEQAVLVGIYTEQGVEASRTHLNFYVDFDVTDSLAFMNCNRGTIRHYGDLINRKTDTAGNELPWFYMTEDPDDRNKPIFEHVEGNYISGTHPLYAGSQNNELISVQKLCKIILNGKYQNSGEAIGVGTWPILLMQNQSLNVGVTTVILNGDFKNLDGAISPIRYVDASQEQHTFKIISKCTTIETRNDFSIDSNKPISIYVYHSLTMNKNYNSAFITDGMSEDRTIVDTNVEVTVPGYGV